MRGTWLPVWASRARMAAAASTFQTASERLRTGPDSISAAHRSTPLYHTRQETPDQINYDRMARVIGGLARVVTTLASAPVPWHTPLFPIHRDPEQRNGRAPAVARARHTAAGTAPGASRASMPTLGLSGVTGRSSVSPQSNRHAEATSPPQQVTSTARQACQGGWRHACRQWPTPPPVALQRLMLCHMRGTPDEPMDMVWLLLQLPSKKAVHASAC